MSIYGCNMNLELQQRAVEYYAVLKNFENLREGLFEQMPPMEMKQNQTYTNGIPGLDNGDEIPTEEEQQQQQLRQQQEAAKTLLNIFSEDPIPGTTPPSQPIKSGLDIFDSLYDDLPKPNINTNKQPVIDLLSNELDLVGLGTSSTINTKPAQKQIDIFEMFESSSVSSKEVSNKTPVSTNLSAFDDLLGLGSSSTVTKSSQPSNNDAFDIFSSSKSSKLAEVLCYEKNELKITFTPAAQGNNSNETQHFIQMNALNTSVSQSVREFLFGVAVPKTMQMQLTQPTTSIIQPLDSMSQIIAISNPKKASLLIFISVGIHFFGPIFFNL